MFQISEAVPNEFDKRTGDYKRAAGKGDSASCFGGEATGRGSAPGLPLKAWKALVLLNWQFGSSRVESTKALFLFSLPNAILPLLVTGGGAIISRTPAHDLRRFLVCPPLTVMHTFA